MGKDEDIFILSVAIITVKGNNVWNIKITRSHRVTFSLLIAMVFAGRRAGSPWRLVQRVYQEKLLSVQTQKKNS